MAKATIIVTVSELLGLDVRRYVHFNKRCLSDAISAVGDQILLYRSTRDRESGFFAYASLREIQPVPRNQTGWIAVIERYQPLPSRVPLHIRNQFFESKLAVAAPNGNGRLMAQAVRTMSDADFEAILAYARSAEEHQPLTLAEAPAPPLSLSRERVSSTRLLRDTAFRRRVLEEYDYTCAFSGISMISADGLRCEGKACHIQPVSAGGRDVIWNGLCLTSTWHWLLDEGLVSLLNDGTFLFAPKASRDVLEFPRLGKRARFPKNPNFWPKPEFLAFHRQNVFRG